MQRQANWKSASFGPRTIRKGRAVDPRERGPDIRQRPWYVAARDAGCPVWTETFVFLGLEGIHGIHGLTYATPIYRNDGSLVAVLDADFKLTGLCRFFRSLQVGRSGFAFVVELRADGTRRVIAHPDPGLLQRAAGGQASEAGSELVPAEEIADSRVAAFLAKVPATVHREDPQTRLPPMRFRVDGVNHLGAYRLLGGEAAPHWLICMVIPETDLMDRVDRNNRLTALAAMGAFLVALLVSLSVSSQVARPLRRLLREAEAIGHLRLERQPVQHSVVAEVDRLGVAMEEMKTGLRSFRKYVPPELVRSFLALGREASLGGERRTMTILFCDIQDFTAIAERLAPEDLVEHLRDYLGSLSASIIAAGGTVDKYIGDAIMAFWGAPAPNPRHATDACRAALRCQAKLQELRPGWQAAGKPPFFARIGVNTGEVVVGNIGSEARLEYTVIGDAVNLASRLEGLNRYYGTDLLISESTYREALSGVFARPLDWVAVKGKTKALLVYELMGLKGEVDPAAEELTAIYGQALARYRQQDWSTAIALFEAALRVRAGDPPAQCMIARCRGYQKQSPGDDWDGVHRLDHK
jgi:adenylate cyclase